MLLQHLLLNSIELHVFISPTPPPSVCVSPIYGVDAIIRLEVSQKKFTQKENINLLCHRCDFFNNEVSSIFFFLNLVSNFFLQICNVFSSINRIFVDIREIPLLISSKYFKLK